MGTGFLGVPVNKIDLWVQALGFGEGDLESPITTATVDLLLDLVPAEDPQMPPVTIVSACAFRSGENIKIGTEKSEGKLVCKLLNSEGNAIAEGDITFLSYTAGDILTIPINQPIFIGATNFKNVYDAMIIVQGPL